MWNISPHFRSYNVTGLGKNFLTLLSVNIWQQFLALGWKNFVSLEIHVKL